MNKYYKGLLILLVGSIVIGCSSDRPVYQRGRSHTQDPE